MDDHAQDHPLSDDPEEAMRLENELTRLKLQAEYGAQFGGDMSLLPPEVEKKFLEHIQQMEESLHDTDGTTVGAILGYPELPESHTLDAIGLEEHWQQLAQLLERKNINIIFSPEVPTAERYRFVREEVMPLPFLKNLPAEAVFHLAYESFYPNHERMLRELTADWFSEILQASQNSGDEELPEEKPDLSLPNPFLEEHETENEADFSEWMDLFSNRPDQTEDPLEALSNGLILPDGRALSISDLKTRIADFQAQFASVVSFHLEIDKAAFEEASTTDPPVAIAEAANSQPAPPELQGSISGRIAFTVIHEDQEKQLIEGPFSVSTYAQDGWWSVRYFEMPGWIW